MECLVQVFQARQLALLSNPLPMPVVLVSVGSARDCQGFVSVARSTPQKGIDVLIRAFAQIAGPSWVRSGSHSWIRAPV
jgi:glycosyltransferase involved in cell wall biosynthesis